MRPSGTELLLLTLPVRRNDPRAWRNVRFRPVADISPAHLWMNAGLAVVSNSTAMIEVGLMCKDAGYYLARAQRCRELAEAAHSNAVRQMLLEMTVECERKAHELSEAPRANKQ